MCGITGYININGRPITDTSAIFNMLKIMKHRGPDDSGVRAINLKDGVSEEFSAHEIASVTENFDCILGFNRLSILDLSKNGHQPMVSPDEKVILMLNGEIYNAFDYTDELFRWGYKFKSATDTEVVLALYLKYGFERMLEKLNGMFSIVITDLNEKIMYLARDRFGIKPLYYTTFGDYLAFSSELKSFYFLDNFNFELNEKSIDEFLIFRNNLSGTLFKNIWELEPGHFLVYEPDKKLSKKQYFNPDNYLRNNSTLKSLDEFGVELQDWLGQSVKSQLMSDVKLGCQLSGGIDSSLVTWLANMQSSKGNFESVSIVFNNNIYSEEKYIDKVANDLNITSHKFLLDSAYYLENIEQATWHLETPINHPNSIGIYKLSQRAKDYVTVLLSGEGADEVFGGYERFYSIGYPYNIRRLLGEIRKGVNDPRQFLRYFDHRNRALMATAYMLPYLAKRLYSTFDINRALTDRNELYNSLSGSKFDKQVKYEMKAYLPDLLIRQDKMSMAHSIENRVPFLDYRLVANSFSIPERILLLRKSQDGGLNNQKYLLKKIAGNIFGNQFAFRDKMGFGIPLKDFFSQNDFYDYLYSQVLPGIKGRGIFNSQLITHWVSNIQSLKYYELEALWVIVSFEIWASIYLDLKYENWNT